MYNEPKKDFVLHPEGPCMAVCRDIWVETLDNPKARQINQWGNIEPDRITYIHFEFLTEEPVEYNGKLSPSFAKKRVTKSWGEKSNCRKFISSWDPVAGRNDALDLESFVGRGAYLNIVHETKDGRTYANIATIAAPPKGATIPSIPADFVRHKDKQGVGQTAPTDSDLSF